MFKFKETDLDNLVMERLGIKQSTPNPNREMLQRLMDVAVTRTGGIPEIPTFEVKPVEKL